MGDNRRKARGGKCARRRASALVWRWLPMVIALLFAAQIVGPMRGESPVVAYPDVAGLQGKQSVEVYGFERIQCEDLALEPGPERIDASTNKPVIDTVRVYVGRSCDIRRLRISAMEGQKSVSGAVVVVRPGETSVTASLVPPLAVARSVWWSVSSDAAQ